MRIRHDETMNSRVEQSGAQRRFTMVLMTTFGAIALILSVVATYGLVAYAVEQRKREIGVRMAPGATAAT